MKYQIELTEPEIKWIKLCKYHYDKDPKYTPTAPGWLGRLHPMFVEIYGWDPTENDNMSEFLNVIFNKLLSLYMKIVDPQESITVHIKEIFSAAFYKGISNDSDFPIERAIHCLCGMIQNNRVINDDGSVRYKLNLD